MTRTPGLTEAQRWLWNSIHRDLRENKRERVRENEIAMAKWAITNTGRLLSENPVLAKRISKVLFGPEPRKPGCCVDREAGQSNGCTEETCMRIPAPNTCGTCVHYDHCHKLFGAEFGARVCDYFPRRFELLEEAPDANRG